MKNKSIIETILTGITAFFLLMFLVLMPIDIVGFYQEKEVYAMVHHLDTSQKNWEWDYLNRWIYIGGLSIIGLTLISLRLMKKENQTIKILNWTFLILFLMAMIFGFYSWMNTGFDH